MNIPSSLIYSAPVSLGPQVSNRGQNVADSIAEANISAAEHRKALAARQLEDLRERLRIMMLFSGSSSKGNAEAAAKIARDIAAAVKQYADGSSSLANAGAAGSSDADENFLNSARQLSSMVKAIITAEARKEKDSEKDNLKSAVRQMDSAIGEASRVIGKGREVPPLYTLDMNGGIVSTFA